MWRNLWPFPWLLWPTDVSPCISLCLWMGVVIHWVPELLLRALWDAQWGQPQRICMWDLHQPGSNSELSKAHSGTQLSTDWRCWANPTHDNCLVPYPSPLALSGWVGFGDLCSTESWWYCQQWALRSKCITSDCFFFHSPWMYLYMPVLAHLVTAASGRGADIWVAHLKARFFTIVFTVSERNPGTIKLFQLFHLLVLCLVTNIWKAKHHL